MHLLREKLHVTAYSVQMKEWSYHIIQYAIRYKADTTVTPLHGGSLSSHLYCHVYSL